ncbi:hypothetical protein EMIHUDRAFT_237561 [Emiliania huxleyi CCMP1516]|uniref:Uncharacterized protein n=2 Tax=Emiliania huxleyi TaxID=2903 RepID=A0A0D3JPW8_EMIH1|nr:hypothetical protein EMIHUDRAFT_237561 [Emiliania huxleyi CCMP1516]EOD25553.1 hypothetical protein EMIHUDRAFT_237561 [Emiliania huxleyi CCMP1516]|eukprot:XP_005777982.1 hypothetical protein EMIHUDRAFT_237561 [Emiliania huxleyi CCMP1516]
MALGEAEGGVAAGTRAEDITEVLKSERAGRRLPLKEDEITASAELLAKYVTADEVWSSLGDEDLFGVYADTFAQAIGKELPPIQMALAKKWWMDARPAPREKEAVEVSSPPLACIRFSGKQKGKQRVPSTLRFRKFPGKTEGVWCSILEPRCFP